MLKKEELLKTINSLKSSKCKSSHIKHHLSQDNTRGITLIALVVTILVLVILARYKYKYIIWR